MQTQNTRWYYLSMIPSLIALLGCVLFAVLIMAGIPQDGKLRLVAAFAFADLTTILAGFGGVMYLINSQKTAQARRWVWINVTLFFAATFAGVVLFMQL